MYQEERIVKILEELSARGRLSNQEVCDLLDISRDTARRDIIKLVNEGSAVRTHGGIASTFYKQEVKKYKDRGFLNRKDHASQSKIAIAERANQMIHSKDMCFFDVSTTITFLSELVEEETIIFTHSLDNAGRLVEKDHVELHLLGGKFHKKNRFFYDLFHFNELIKDLHFDRVFIGAAGITEEGVYFADREDALIKRAIIKKAKQVVLLAEQEKFNQTSHYIGADLVDIDVLITDDQPPEHLKETLRQLEIEIDIVSH